MANLSKFTFYAMDFGHRITCVTSKLDILTCLFAHTRLVKAHTRLLKAHTKLLKAHTRLLEAHTRLLEAHNRIIIR